MIIFFSEIGAENPATAGFVGRSVGSIFDPVYNGACTSLEAAARIVTGGTVQQKEDLTFVVIKIGRRFLRLDFCDEGLEWMSLSEHEMKENLKTTEDKYGGLKCGEFEVGKIDISRIILALEKFKNKTYDLSDYNCQHFCDEFITDLVCN